MIGRRRLMMYVAAHKDLTQQYDSDMNPIDTAVPELSPYIESVDDVMEDRMVPELTLTMELINA